jgi:hypothetical protein
MPRLDIRILIVALALVASVGSADRPAVAAPGDKAGWQFLTEGTGEGERQFLIYVERDNGPRVLTLACERDIDTFGFYSEDLLDFVGPIAKATMTLEGGPARFTIPGVIEADPDTQALGFVAQLPPSGGEQRLEATLVPLLVSKTPIHLSFGKRSRELPPVTGLFDPARRFLRGCFSHSN